MSQQKLLSSSLSKKIVRYPEESGAFQKITLGDAFNAGMAEIITQTVFTIQKCGSSLVGLIVTMLARSLGG